MYFHKNDGHIYIEDYTGYEFLNKDKDSKKILFEDYESLKKNIIKILEKRKFISDYDGIFNFKFYENRYKNDRECTMTCKLKKGVFHTEDSDPSIYINVRCITLSLWHKNGALHREKGPAFSYQDDNMHVDKWYKNNKIHRLDENNKPNFMYPAYVKVEYYKGCPNETQKYFLNNKEIHATDLE